MAVAFVQDAVVLGTANATTFTITLGSNVTSGNTLIVAVNNYVGSGAVISSMSGCGATWSRVVQSAANGSQQAEIWKGTGATTGATVTVTMTSGTFYGADANLSEWSGVTSGVAAGSTATFGTGSGNATNPVAPAVALTSGDAAYDFLAWQSSRTFTSTDSPAAFTALQGGYEGPTLGWQIDPEYRVATGSESASHQANLSSGSNYALAASVILRANAPATARRSGITAKRRVPVFRGAVI